MRRADRLFQIVQHLRGGRLVTASRLAERLEVSERTIYRDIVDLKSTGVPIDGEAGVGYILREGFDLPPLMFTRDEVVALVIGARLARAWGGAATARAAEEALIKIEAVLPETERHRVARTPIHAADMIMAEEDRLRFDLLERAAETCDVVAVAYRDEKGAGTERAIRPLGLWFWGRVWTLVAWCELRNDFRTFRLDRIVAVELAGRRFRTEPDKTLKAFFRRMEAGDGSYRRALSGAPSR
ncbi:MAG TPA: YafY family protein [Pararhizobium sp.]|nr:YafY family protein [Pararhizobium sp.]